MRRYLRAKATLLGIVLDLADRTTLRRGAVHRPSTEPAERALLDFEVARDEALDS